MTIRKVSFCIAALKICVLLFLYKGNTICLYMMYYVHVFLFLFSNLGKKGREKQTIIDTSKTENEDNKTETSYLNVI